MTGKYISLQEASKLCPYSQEYLSLRARQGKLKAIKLGRNWVTTQEWLKEYIEEVRNQIKDGEEKFVPGAKPKAKIEKEKILEKLLGQPIDKGLTLVDRLILRANRISQRVIPRYTRLTQLLARHADNLIEHIFQTGQKLKPSPKLYRPKFILSSALIILLLISSIFLVSPVRSFQRANQKNEELKLKLKFGLMNLPKGVQRAEKNLSLGIRQGLDSASGKVRALAYQAPALPRLIYQWGIVKQAQTKQFLINLPNRFLSTAELATDYLSGRLSDMVVYLSDMPEKVSDISQNASRELISRLQGTYSALQFALKKTPASLADGFSQFNQKLSQKITATSQVT